MREQLKRMAMSWTNRTVETISTMVAAIFPSQPLEVRPSLPSCRDLTSLASRPFSEISDSPRAHVTCQYCSHDRPPVFTSHLPSRLGEDPREL